MNKWVKWTERIKAFAGVVTAVVAVSTIAWGLVVGLGLVISRSEAQQMVDLKATSVVAQLAQVVAQEENARRDADLEFQKDLTLQRLQLLLAVEDRTEAQELEVESLKRQLERIESKLDGET